MSSFASFLKKTYVQTAVYWGTPQIDGYGGFTYGTPVEIKCRWEEKAVIFDTQNGKALDFVSSAVVYTAEDLEIGGVLYLGTLVDLNQYLTDSSDSYVPPEEMEHTFPIRKLGKIPALGSTTVFTRVAYLTPFLTGK